MTDKNKKVVHLYNQESKKSIDAMPSPEDLVKDVVNGSNKKEIELLKEDLKNKPTYAGDHVMGNKIGIVNNYHGTVYQGKELTKSEPEDRRKKQDDTAEKQGRVRIGTRKVGKRVHPKFMTPKEYSNYCAGLWDGIETRENHNNYQEYDWVAGRVVVERSEHDRRQEDVAYEGRDRRISVRARRMTDREAEKMHRNFVFALFTILFIHIGFVLYGYFMGV